MQHFPNLRDSCSGSFIGLVLGNVDVGVSFVYLFMLEQELFSCKITQMQLKIK